MAYRGVEVQFHSFLTLALDVAEWSTSHPGHLTLDKKPQYPLKRRLGGFQSESGQFREGKKNKIKLMALPAFEPMSVQPLVFHVVSCKCNSTMLTELVLLLYTYTYNVLYMMGG